MANARNVILPPHLRQRLRGKTSRFTLPRPPLRSPWLPDTSYVRRPLESSSASIRPRPRLWQSFGQTRNSRSHKGLCGVAGLRPGRLCRVGQQPLRLKLKTPPLPLRPVDLVAAEWRQEIAGGVSPLEWMRKPRPSREAATSWGQAWCRRFAATRPFPYSVLGLTPQATLFRRFAATKSTGRLRQ